VQEVDLDNLSCEAGVAYLAHLGVRGSQAELWAAAEEYAGHALALTLLGGYLKLVYAGDLRQRDRIPRLADEARQGAHARRVMAGYAGWFAGRPELELLYLLGLFDRPAAGGALGALRAAPPVAGLTGRLAGLDAAGWSFAVDALRAARLVDPPDEAEPEALDCHPLLREYFGERLRAEGPAAWREGHRRLYEYYKAAAPELPDTLEEMTPLFAAVSHGCAAGLHQAALDEVYWRRIRRGNEYFSVRKLGAFGADLAALAGFFDPP
jgi:hypothetical protein